MSSNIKGGKTPGQNKQDEIVDVEEYAKEGKVPPSGARYRIRIDKQKFEVDAASMTGRELLELAGKRPPERYRIDMKLRGGETRLVPLDESADFTTPGLERFMTLPLDQTEG
ncbi:MAG TPA: multiubiquitin domain-containing protein [Longimicrobium sp.]